jgi:hypothetical protein
MRGGGNCSSTTDATCEVPGQVPTDVPNPMNIDAEKLKYQQAIQDYQEAEKKAEDAKSAFKSNPNSETKFKAEMAIRDKFAKKNRLDHRKTMLTNTLRLRKKGGRRLKHRKTHKKRWASRTTLRRS